MGRPCKPIEELKNPRRIRKSPVTATILDVPNPTKAQLAMWAPIVEEAMIAVLSNEDRNDNLAKKVKMRMKIPLKWKYPEGFPRGRIVEKTDTHKVVEINAELILVWLYEHKLAKYSPTMLYKERQGFLNRMTRLTNSVDIDFDNLYNDEIVIE